MRPFPSSLAAFGQTHKFTLLHINDMHSRVKPASKYDSGCRDSDEAKGKCFGGAARITQAINDVKAANAVDPDQGTLVVDAGDQMMGSLWSTYYRGQAACEMQKVMGIQAMAVGNHEFDYGPDKLTEYAECAKDHFPILSCNCNAHSHERVKNNIKKWTIVEVDNALKTKVGIIGVTTPRTTYISNTQGKVAFNEIIPSVREAVDELKDQGVNIFILLSHCGLGVDMETAAAVPELDVIVGGHTHSFLYSGNPPGKKISEPDDSGDSAVGPYPTMVDVEGGKKVALVQARCYTRYIGKLDLEFDANGNMISHSGNPILLGGAASTSDIANDPATLAKIDELNVGLDIFKSTNVGVAQKPLLGSKPYVRFMEVSTANLVSQSQLRYAATSSNMLEYFGVIDIALMNGGGVRASVKPGPITIADVHSILPFANVMAVMSLTGAEILQVLEHSVADVEEDAGQFLHPAGIRYVFDSTKKPYSRIKTVLVNAAGIWQPLDPLRSYLVMTNDFLARGGDGFDTFANAPKLLAAGAELASVLIDYFGTVDYVRPIIDQRIVDCGNVTGYGTPGDTACTVEPFTRSEVKATLFFENYSEKQFSDRLLRTLQFRLSQIMGVFDTDITIGKPVAGKNPPHISVNYPMKEEPEHTEVEDVMVKEAVPGTKDGVLIDITVYGSSWELAKAAYSGLYAELDNEKRFTYDLKQAGFTRLKSTGCSKIGIFDYTETAATKKAATVKAVVTREITTGAAVVAAFSGALGVVLIVYFGTAFKYIFRFGQRMDDMMEEGMEKVAP